MVADALRRMREAVAPGVSTAELDAIAEEVIRAAGAIPSFKGYQGYPASICASVNEPGRARHPGAGQVLHDGDLISIDCGAVLDGWHGDAAITVAVGEVDPDAAAAWPRSPRTRMWAGIAAAPGAPLAARAG